MEAVQQRTLRMLRIEKGRKFVREKQEESFSMKSENEMELNKDTYSQDVQKSHNSGPRE